MTKIPHIHQDIIKRCIAGDRKSQYELYTLYSRAMFAIAMRIMNNREEAEDILQESFVKAFSKLDSFREEANFGSWLKRIVINHSLNAVKKKRLVFQELNEEIYQSPQEEEQEEEEDYTVEDIREAMKELPDGYRIIFSLFMFEGQSHAQIASSMNISEVTSRSQLSRAKNKIRQLIFSKKIT